MKIHSVKFNAVMNAILTTSTFIFPLITVPYVSRVLSVEANGEVAFAQYVVQLIMYVTVLGIPTYGVRECAAVRDDSQKLAKLVKELLVILGVATTICYVLYVIAVFTVPQMSGNKALFMIFSINIVLGSLGVEWFYQAIEQYSYITIRNILFKAMSVIGMFIFVRQSNDVIQYAILLVFAVAASNMVNIARLVRILDLTHVKTGKLQIKKHVKPVMVFFIANFARNLYQNSDVVLLGFFTGNYQVGIYQLVTKIKSVLFGGVNSVGNVMMPRLSYYLKGGNKSGYYDLLKKNINFLFFISAGLEAYILLFAEDIVRIVAGEAFLSAANPLRLIGLVVVLACFNVITGVQMLTTMGREKQMALATVVGAVASVVVNVSLDGALGALGAAIAAVCADGVIMILQLYFAFSVVKKVFSLKNFIKIVVSSVVATMLSFALIEFTALNWILSFIVGSMLFGFVYLLCTICSGEESVRYLCKVVLRKLRK
ncbi:flippase [Bifidobacterium parmae]|uniref:Transporter n=1 Tax=Bifidobacterium parmae TaxID=361854 RepID=A0A2N5J0G8_9BIFI|nr:flippase [Bifidobacterium parmae]PLS27705.1 transporter [Bifidobacterium parmae]